MQVLKTAETHREAPVEGIIALGMQQHSERSHGVKQPSASQG